VTTSKSKSLDVSQFQLPRTWSVDSRQGMRRESGVRIIDKGPSESRIFFTPAVMTFDLFNRHVRALEPFLANKKEVQTGPAFLRCLRKDFFG
jgi:hypothetical protein